MNNKSTTANENILAGAVGAFLFSLVGGILWFVLYQIGYVASVSGLIGVVCAVKGYTFFAKTKDESKKCLIISVISAVIVLVISWYFCVAYDIYLAYQDWFAAGEVDFTVTFFEAIRLIPYFFEDTELLVAYLKDLGLGVLFAGIGVLFYLKQREKKMKKLAAEKILNTPTVAETEPEAETPTENESTQDETVQH